MSASLDGTENWIFAFSPTDDRDSISISIDGDGIPENGQTICKVGQLG